MRSYSETKKFLKEKLQSNCPAQARMFWEFFRDSDPVTYDTIEFEMEDFRYPDMLKFIDLMDMNVITERYPQTDTPQKQWTATGYKATGIDRIVLQSPSKTDLNALKKKYGIKVK